MRRIARVAARKDVVGGVMVLATGLAAVLIASGYTVGTPSRMGPGFFPVMVGAILAASGLIIALKSVLGAAVEEGLVLRIEWRGWSCILAGLVAFILLGGRLGLLPATFALVFIAALGDRNNGIRTALALAVAMCCVAVVIFWWLLQVQFPLLTGV